MDAVGPKITLPKRPVELTPAGDHYQLAVPFSVLLDTSGTQAAGPGSVTASLKPLDQGKWAVDDVMVPSPGHFAFDMGPPGSKLPVEVDMKLASQNTHILFDPTFATASTMTSTVGAIDLHVTSLKQDQTQHIDGTTSHAALTPTTAGRVDVTEDAAAQNFSVQAHSVGGDDHTMKLEARHLTVAGHLDDVDRLKVLTALQAITRLSSSMATALAPDQATAGHAAPANPTKRPAPAPAPGRAGTPAKPPSPAQAAAAALDRAAIRGMILTLRDIASGGEINEALDGMAVMVDGHGGAAEHVQIGLGATAPGGMLQAHVEMGLDGLAVPELPPTMAVYLPKHFKVRPFVSGISVADVTKMALDATGPNGDRAPDPTVLFSHGGITFGIESLALDLGASSFAGNATMVAKSPGDISGKAQLTATNFDALMETVQKDPMLSAGFPVMVMLRGLGRQNGEQMVWDIAVANNAVTVNGTDLTAMLGGGKK